jgi:hypothetical protein
MVIGVIPSKPVLKATDAAISTTNARLGLLPAVETFSRNGLMPSGVPENAAACLVFRFPSKSRR